MRLKSSFFAALPLYLFQKRHRKLCIGFPVFHNGRQGKGTSNIGNLRFYQRACLCCEKKKERTYHPNLHIFQVFMQRYTSWWFQPSWKILVKMGIFPKVRGENKTCLSCHHLVYWLPFLPSKNLQGWQNSGVWWSNVILYPPERWSEKIPRTCCFAG